MNFPLTPSTRINFNYTHPTKGRVNRTGVIEAVRRTIKGHVVFILMDDSVNNYRTFHLRKMGQISRV